MKVALHFFLSNGNCVLNKLAILRSILDKLLTLSSILCKLLTLRSILQNVVWALAAKETQETSKLALWTSQQQWWRGTVALGRRQVKSQAQANREVDGPCNRDCGRRFLGTLPKWRNAWVKLRLGWGVTLPCRHCLDYNATPTKALAHGDISLLVNTTKPLQKMPLEKFLADLPLPKRMLFGLADSILSMCINCSTLTSTTWLTW